MTKKTTSNNSKNTTQKPAAKAKPKMQTKKSSRVARPEAEPPVVAKPERIAQALEPNVSETAEGTKARTRDPRLPAPGTVLQKKDRHGDVRCECTVEDAGILFKGKLYRSLSAAAMAASKDLGLGGQAQNGFLFWNLATARKKDPVAALEHAWERYRARAEGVLKTNVTEANRAEVVATVSKHVDMLEALRQTVG